jgi:hypothetical protein
MNEPTKPLWTKCNHNEKELINSNKSILIYDNY